jgi:hypothetical protein
MTALSRPSTADSRLASSLQPQDFASIAQAAPSLRDAARESDDDFDFDKLL